MDTMEASLPVQDLELFQSSQVGFRHAAFRVAERSALPPPMRADTCQSTAFEYQRDAIICKRLRFAIHMRHCRVVEAKFCAVFLAFNFALASGYFV